MTDEFLGEVRAGVLVSVLGAAVGSRGMPAASEVIASLATLTLSERARALAGAVLQDLGGDPAHVRRVVLDALNDERFTDWILWPAGLAVAWSSIEAADEAAFDDGMEVLRELTPRMTSEFSVRPMLLHDLDRALGHMAGWADDPDWHVRRLASEGSRPLLPWAERLPEIVKDPERTRPILDALYADPEESVRRSVANHLNDHSRFHPEFSVATVAGWQRIGGHEVARTSRHALRTLVKRGDPGALELLGFAPAELSVSPLALSTDVLRMGDTIEFCGEVRNVGEDPANLAIDYVLTFPGARGSSRSKVFKIAQRLLAPGELTMISASHSFRQITTRRYYPGNYSVALQINGALQTPSEFTVEG